jgi:hypothetical protein
LSRANLGHQGFSARLAELLGVVDTRELCAVAQADGSGDDGAKERPTADLIGADDGPQSVAPQRSLDLAHDGSFSVATICDDGVFTGKKF